MDANPIVVKAVQKAISNGWREDEFRGDKRLKWPPQDITLVEDKDYYSNSGWWLESNSNRTLSAQVCQSDDYEDLLFNKEFAKALWGEEYLWYGFPSHPKIQFEIKSWQYHLQQMVIADDPVKYLADNI